MLEVSKQDLNLSGPKRMYQGMLEWWVFFHGWEVEPYDALGRLPTLYSSVAHFHNYDPSCYYFPLHIHYCLHYCPDTFTGLFCSDQTSQEAVAKGFPAKTFPTPANIPSRYSQPLGAFLICPFPRNINSLFLLQPLQTFPI